MVLLKVGEEEFLSLGLSTEVLQSRFECIEGVTEGEELIEVHGERHLH
jgi:hypothetical protein